ncbi:unnamed protein product [Bursaphelenchus okinawaensis]|uniref:Uncharacterized protein n=1 Tax=Bursaphelenchus okinawaensis TaxID=465554 RepID=A0A811L7C1_9BILA|nr:unnamed protein product [Bursaphelenchus okinawaensis]CAG9118206.1 unnamed protein product [Bursaphelenchus okinawaensis]
MYVKFPAEAAFAIIIFVASTLLICCIVSYLNQLKQLFYYFLPAKKNHYVAQVSDPSTLHAYIVNRNHVCSDLSKCKRHSMPVWKRSTTFGSIYDMSMLRRFDSDDDDDDEEYDEEGFDVKNIRVSKDMCYVSVV